MCYLKDLSFGSTEKFCELVDDVISDSENEIVDIVAKYDDVKEILKELVYYGRELEFVELEPAEWNGYDKEYSISVFDNKVSCEKLWHEDRYYGSDAEIVFFMEDVNSKVIKSYPECSKMYEVHIKDDEDEFECDEDCDNCLLNDDNTDISIAREDDGMHGFTVTQSDEHGCSSYSYYSTDTIDGYTLERLLDIFGV